MANLGPVLKQLSDERKRAKQELDRLDTAIAAIEKLAGKIARPVRAAKQKPHRRLSAAARKRISEAQKERWARIRKQKAA